MIFQATDIIQVGGIIQICDDQIIMRENREQEKEKSEVPKRNRKKNSDSPERKSDTHETVKFLLIILIS